LVLRQDWQIFQQVRKERMARRWLKLAPALSAAIVAAGLSACASGPASDRAQYVEEPVAQLYNRGMDMLDQRRWSEALKAFEEVERQHPYSTWSRRSMLMASFANYQSNNYDEAIEGAQRFIALHPGNESAPYAYYLVALSYFEQIMDVGRDQSTTERALKALDDVVRRFPDTDYARDARLKIDMSYDQLAGKEMEVGRFYLARGQHLAAANRFRRVVDDKNFQRTTHTPEALHRLVECYLSMGLDQEAQRAAAMLSHNFPNNEWYSRSYTLMTARNVPVLSSDEAKRRGWLETILDSVF
jgi:outer membrane protein assembly factor BamD